MPRYKVMVDDNFHYQDEDERYEDGEFDTLEAAIDRCRYLVDRNLRGSVRMGMSPDKLYDIYQMGGIDPFILTVGGDGPLVPFSAWNYARERCAAICAESYHGGGSQLVASKEIALTLSETLADDVRELIGEGLDAYNIGAAGPYRRKEVFIVARDAEGAVAGGLKGQIDYDWLMIDWLWCTPDRRRQGLGALMMGTAEDFARDRQCLGVWVQTATYQAPDFYRRLGYKEFGRLDELLPGHAMVWLGKRLR